MPELVKKKLPFPIRLLLSTAAFLTLTILTQNIQIFPGALLSILNNSERNQEELPKNVKSFFVRTKDQKKIEVWKVPGEKQKPVILIFHGNGGDLQNFFPYQELFKSAGYTTYNFDYRGYGKSSGWPSEKGLYLDSKAVGAAILELERIHKQDLILVGTSIGSGPASYLAKEYQSKIVILVAPFISLEEAVKAHPVFGFLHKFIWYDFPVLNNLKSLKDTCFVISHGNKDNVIPVMQGQEIFGRLSSSQKIFIKSDSTHNDVFFETFPKIEESLKKCGNFN